MPPIAPVIPLFASQKPVEAREIELVFDGLPKLDGYKEWKPESVGSPSGLRREWRIVASTGELRGLCWRERNANRKAVRYVGKRSKPTEFERYKTAYDEWRGANRTLVAVGLVGSRNVGSPRTG